MKGNLKQRRIEVDSNKEGRNGSLSKQGKERNQFEHGWNGN
jgi:hypothetical protein